MALSTVDLPDPDSPTSPKLSPSAMSSVTPSHHGVAPVADGQVAEGERAHVPSHALRSSTGSDVARLVHAGRRREKALRVGMLRACQLPGPAFLHDLARVHHQDAVAVARDEVEVVADEDEAHARSRGRARRSGPAPAPARSRRARRSARPRSGCRAPGSASSRSSRAGPCRPTPRADRAAPRARGR